MDYKFYMQCIDEKGIPKEGTLKDLEFDFKGLRYKQMDGMSIYGKPKNIYTETYSESEKLKVYLPKKIVHEATKIELTLLFIGKERYEVYSDFNEYIFNGIHKYWDNLRNVSFPFICKESAKPSEDVVNGIQYILVKYTLQNLKGYSEFNKTK